MLAALLTLAAAESRLQSDAVLSGSGSTGATVSTQQRRPSCTHRRRHHCTGRDLAAPSLRPACPSLTRTAEPALFRTYVTCKQYHRRLTDGWRPFAVHHALTAGDAVQFLRRIEDECADALVMRVQVVRGIVR